MPRKPKYTREELVETAVAIIREEGIGSLTARNLVGRLGTAPATIFTHFESMEALEKAAYDRACVLFNAYVEEGLRMTPPFKGFGIRLIKFGIEEPNLFSYINLSASRGDAFEKALEKESHFNTLISLIQNTFSLSPEDARLVLLDLWAYATGIATICATGIRKFSDEEISLMLGRVARGLVLERKNPDPRISIVPGDSAPLGDMESYLSQVNFT